MRMIIIIIIAAHGEYNMNMKTQGLEQYRMISECAGAG